MCAFWCRVFANDTSVPILTVESRSVYPPKGGAVESQLPLQKGSSRVATAQAAALFVKRIEEAR